jgi:sodium transport system permease protein
MKAIFAIFRKEMMDAMRDRRTLLVVLLSSLLGVPLLLLIVSEVLSQVESQEVKRTVVAVGMRNAPDLENYILRQAYQIQEAPSDYEARLRSKDLTQPVLLVPKDFEDKLRHGEKARLEIVFDTANTQAQFGLRPLRKLLDGYQQEQATLALMMRGISPEVLQTIDVRERHLSRPEERKVTIAGMLPFMLIMAIVMGGMYAAIDTTAGERERGSLEPLMMNPVSGWQLAVGKWGAVATVSMTVVILTVLSFFPTQWLIRNETLRAEFQFGAREAIGFLFVLLPLAASLASIQIAVALNCKSYKEAQVRNQILSFMVSMVPLILTFNPGREPAWFQWAPILAQNIMMNHVLQGQPMEHAAMAIAFAVCTVMSMLSLYYIAHKMRRVVTG